MNQLTIDNIATLQALSWPDLWTIELHYHGDNDGIHDHDRQWDVEVWFKQDKYNINKTVEAVGPDLAACVKAVTAEIEGGFKHVNHYGDWMVRVDADGKEKLLIGEAV